MSDRQPDAPPRPGPPRVYGPEIEDEIIARLEMGVPLKQICRASHMPSFPMVYRWVRSRPDFAARFDAARAAGAMALVDDCMDILDAAGPETISWARERANHRKWLASRMHPQLYGDSGAFRSTRAEPEATGHPAPPPVAPSPEAWLEWAKAHIAATDEKPEAEAGTDEKPAPEAGAEGPRHDR